MCDEGTASASEILIGALQDWDRAVIIGRRTFGKGLVQDQYNLSDKSALRLTIARYYTPVGRSIQRSYSNGSKAYYNEISQRFTDTSLYTTDPVKNDSNKIYKNSSGKNLFGGGGISPDHFVGGDTGTISIRTAGIYSRGLLNDHAYRYYLLNQPLLQSYKNPADFASSFQVSDDNWKLFETMSLADSIDLGNLTEKEKAYLYKTIKSAIARQLWRNDGYFRVVNSEDKYVNKALEILNKK